MNSVSKKYRMVGQTSAFEIVRRQQPHFVGTKALLVAEDIASSAMDTMLRYRSDISTLRPKQKSPKDLVTRADIEIQQMAVERLRFEFPGHRIIAEESEGFDKKLLPDKDSIFTWTIDPIDGTSCFAMTDEYEEGKRQGLLPGFTQFGIQMSFMIKWSPVFSIFAAPLMDIDGRGYSVFEASCDLPKAYLNGNMISFGARRPLKTTRALVSLAREFYEDNFRAFAQKTQIFAAMMPRGICSGTEFCLLIARPQNLQDYAHKVTERICIWDLVPGAHIFEKSGGRVNHFLGDPAFPIDPQKIGKDFRLPAVSAGTDANVEELFRTSEAFVFENLVYDKRVQKALLRMKAEALREK